MKRQERINCIIQELISSDSGFPEDALSGLLGFGETAIPPLLRAFESADSPTQKVRCLLLLGEFGEPAVSELERVLDGALLPAIRYHALSALGKTKSPRAIPYLVEAMEKSSESVSYRHAQQLAEIGSPAVPSLIGCLNGPRKIFAAWALGRIRDTSAVPDLILALKREGKYVLGKNEASEHIAVALTTMSLTPAPASSAADVLEIAASQQYTQSSIMYSKSMLGTMGVSAAPLLIEAMAGPPGDEANLAYELLVALGEDILPYLESSLETGSPEQRIKSAMALDALKSQSTIPIFLSLLNDSEFWIREISSGVMGTFKVASALPALILLLNDSSWEVRRSAAESIGCIGDASAVDSLIFALRDEVEKVRLASICSLEKLKAPSAARALAGLLASGTKKEVEAAHRALLSIGSPATKILLEGLDSKDNAAKIRILLILGRIGDAYALPAINGYLSGKDGELRAAAAKSLGKSGHSSAVSRITPLLCDENPIVRTSALEALKSLHDENELQNRIPPSNIPRIISLLASENEEERAASLGLLEVSLPNDSQELLLLHDTIHCVAESGMRNGNSIPRRWDLFCLYIKWSSFLNAKAAEKYKKEGMRPPPRFRNPPKKFGRRNSAERMQNTAAQTRAATGGRRA
jgi:HEAT repeat protein